MTAHRLRQLTDPLCSPVPATRGQAEANANFAVVHNIQVEVTYRDVPYQVRSSRTGHWERLMLSGRAIWDYLNVSTTNLAKRSSFLRYLRPPNAYEGYYNYAMHQMCGQPSEADLRQGGPSAALCTGACKGPYQEQGTLVIKLPNIATAPIAFGPKMSLVAVGTDASCSARCHQRESGLWSKVARVSTPRGKRDATASIELPECGAEADQLEIIGGGACGSCYPVNISIHHIASKDIPNPNALTMKQASEPLCVSRTRDPLLIDRGLHARAVCRGVPDNCRGDAQ